jgi:hypothetical protein
VINPKGELMCCWHCGRDTHAKHGICSICLGHVRHRGESYGRPARPTNTLGGSPIIDDEDDDTSDHQYHGDGYE